MTPPIDAYDASEVDERPRSAYISKKDVRIVIIFGAIVVAIMVPVIQGMKRQSEQHMCKNNFAQISKALSLYLESNNDRYPPAFEAQSNGEPLLIDGKYPVNWMGLLLPGMEQRANFRCPTAQPDEVVDNLHPLEAGKTFPSTYGFYMPWSGWPASMVSDPNNAIIIAETSNRGGNNTYDPNSFAEGPDGFVIGWDDNSLAPTSKSKYVTRLAFPGSKSMKFEESATTRHDNGIHVLYLSGALGRIKPDASHVIRYGGGSEIKGKWATH